MDASTDSKISNLTLRSSATIGPIGVTVSPVEVFVTWVKTSGEHIMFKGSIPNGKHQVHDPQVSQMLSGTITILSCNARHLELQR